MITTGGLLTRIVGSKDFVAQQTYARITKYLNTTAAVLDVAKGLGQNAGNTSTAFGPSAGGWRDQWVRATGLRFDTTTTGGADDLGVFTRCGSFADTASICGYYYRADGGTARIARVDAGGFTNLASATFGPAVNVDFTVEASSLGDKHTAIFTCPSVNGGVPVVLNATDATYPGTDGGSLCGARSYLSTIWVKGLEWAQR